MKQSECLQFLCSFHPESQSLTPEQREVAKLLCPICDDCGAEAHIISEGCKNCLSCEYAEGYVRSGKPNGLQIEKKNPPIKVGQEVMVK